MTRRKRQRERQCGACGDPTIAPNPPWFRHAEYGLCSSCRARPEYRAMAEDYARNMAETCEPEPPRPAQSSLSPEAPIGQQRPQGPPRPVQRRDPAEGWPPFVPLRAAPPVAKMTRDMLPASLASWIFDIARRQDVPPGFAAIPALVAASALVGRRVGVAPKARDDWTEVPNLWGMVVARSGAGKTPTEQEALEPYREIAEAAMRAYSGEGPPPPYEAGDATVEALGMRMSEIEDGRALLVVRSELSGLLATFERRGYEGARAFYLEAHDGKTRHRVDRVTRDSLDGVACLSLYGGIQPGALAKHVAAAMGHGRGDDGLLQRFGLGVYPDPKRSYDRVDDYPDAEARDCANAAFRRLAELDARRLGAKPVGRKRIPALRFAPDAQSMFDEWHDDVMLRTRRNDEGHSDTFGSYLSKLRGLGASLALLFHLLDLRGERSEGTDRVSTGRALALAGYLEQHALKIYGEGKHGVSAGVMALATMLENGEVRDGASLRDVYRNKRKGLTNRDEALACARELERWGWVRLEFGERRSVIIHVRPDLDARRVRHEGPNRHGA